MRCTLLLLFVFELMTYVAAQDRGVAFELHRSKDRGMAVAKASSCPAYKPNLLHLS